LRTKENHQAADNDGMPRLKRSSKSCSQEGIKTGSGRFMRENKRFGKGKEKQKILEGEFVSAGSVEKRTIWFKRLSSRHRNFSGRGISQGD